MTPEPIGEGTALIADDDEFFRAAVRAILTSSMGFADVVEAASFDEAVECLGDGEKGAAISLAVFDLSMPGISNPANLRSVRETIPNLPIIVASASERRCDIINSLDAGVHGYVPKRLGIEELERAIRIVLSGDVYVPILLTDVSRIDAEPSPEPARTNDLPRPVTPRAPDLTPRQRDVLSLIVKGKSNKEIARALGLAEGTVRVHMTSMFRSLGVANRTAAAVAGSMLLADTERPGEQGIPLGAHHEN